MRRLLIALTACALGAAAIATPVAIANAAQISALTVTATNVGNHDRVTLTYAEPATMPEIEANAEFPYGLGSGKPMGIGDSTYFLHESRWVDTHEFDFSDIDNRAHIASLPAVRGVRVQLYHGLLYIAIGLKTKAEYTVTLDGNSVHIDVSH